MTGPEKESKESGLRLLAFLSLGWVILFALVPLLFFLDKESMVIPEDTEVIRLTDAFPLKGAQASDFTVIGSHLARLEDQGLALLDAAGREQSFIRFPYRNAQWIRLEDSLIVTPDQGGGFMWIQASGASLEWDTTETLYGADSREDLVLTLGPSGPDKTAVMLYDTSKGSNPAALTFSSLEWPLQGAFVPGVNAFDLLLLDLSQGKAATRLLRFDLGGATLFDQEISDDELFPRLAYLGSDQVVLYNDQSLILLDRQQGQLTKEDLPGTLVTVQARAGRLALLTRQEGQGLLSLVQSSRPGEAGHFLQPPEGEGLTHIALAADAFTLLASRGDELLLFDAESGDLIARQPVEGTVTGLLALDNYHFLIVFEEEAALATIS